MNIFNQWISTTLSLALDVGSGRPQFTHLLMLSSTCITVYLLYHCLPFVSLSTTCIITLMLNHDTTHSLLWATPC